MDIVGEASDGRSAVALAQTLEPDIIIMDVTMLEMGGIEATRQIKTKSPNIKIRALTAQKSGNCSNERYT